MPTAVKSKPLKAEAPTPCGPLQDLRDVLRFVKPSISSEQTRYYLNSVFIDLHHDGLKIRATDGHRLHQVKLPGNCGDAGWQRLQLSTAHVADICKLKNSQCDGLTYAIDFSVRTLFIRDSGGGNVALYTHASELACVVDVDRVQPHQTEAVFSLKGKALLPFLGAACGNGPYKAIAITTDPVANRLTLDQTILHDCGELKLADTVGSGTVHCYTRIGFQPAYLREVIRAFGAHTQITLNSPDAKYAGSPVRFTAENDDAPYGERSVVLMPCRV